MLIRDWMKKQVFSVTPDMTLHDCHRLLKRNNIHNLPVLNAFGIVIGMISEISIKRVSPMNATGLEIIEYLDLLDKTRVKEVMEPDPATTFRIVVGDDAVLRTMAENDRQQRRYSGLRWRLAHSGKTR